MHPPTSSHRHGRAVVLGASMAGLLAARVLSEHFAEVVLLERDDLPEGAAARKGTPQAVHPHGLLARGLEVLETLFPGFTAALQRRGGVLGDLQADIGFYADHARFAAAEAGRPALGASRLAIEAELRQRVRAIPGVRLITGVDALAPRLDGTRVVAACWRERADAPGAAGTQELAAGLVVDCTGRGSHAPAWLREWGYEPPHEERVEIGICYTSAYFSRTGSCAMDRPGLDLVAEFGAVTNAQPRPHVVIAQEPAADGVPRWVVSVGGFAGDHAEPTLQALRERAAAIGCPMLGQITREGELIGEVMRYQVPYSRRRYFERLTRLPAGLLVMGDAITSFNPIYGQGMTVAAGQALALHDALARARGAGDGRLAKRFFRAAGRVTDIPWQLAVGGDLSIDAVPGVRPLPLRLVNAYLARVFRVAPHDAVVSAAFQRVLHMLAAPPSLFAPRILWRVFGRGARAGAATASATRAPSVTDAAAPRAG